jgi:hypothetical protein
MIIAQKIAAKNTPSGNPNRGWLVYRADGDNVATETFVDEGHENSEGSVRRMFPGGVVFLPTIYVSPQFVNDARKHGRAWYR